MEEKKSNFEKKVIEGKSIKYTFQVINDDFWDERKRIAEKGINWLGEKKFKGDFIKSFLNPYLVMLICEKYIEQVKDEEPITIFCDAKKKEEYKNSY